MATLSAQIPDSLFKQMEELAKREKLPLDQLVAIALSAQVSAWMTKDYLEERAKRGSWEKFQKVLAKAPDIEPEQRDRL
jgi:hypothetical protein